MTLCVDIGNSTVKFCIFDSDGKIAHHFSFAADEGKSADEFAVLTRSLFALHGCNISDVDSAIVSSVAPALTEKIITAVKALCGCTPLTVGPGVKTSLNIKTDHPGEVGADLVANAVAALACAEAPLVVVDFGTATTVLAIDEKRSLTDVFILPGVYSSYNALTSEAAGIPAVALGTPKSFSGKNTAASVSAGIAYANAFAVDGFIEKIKRHYGAESINAVATGTAAHTVLPLCVHTVTYREHLTGEGLYAIYLKNRT